MTASQKTKMALSTYSVEKLEIARVAIFRQMRF